MIVKESCSSSNSSSFQFRARVPIRVRFTFRARVPICVPFGFVFGCDSLNSGRGLWVCSFELGFFPGPDTGPKSILFSFIECL